MALLLASCMHRDAACHSQYYLLGCITSRVVVKPRRVQPWGAPWPVVSASRRLFAPVPEDEDNFAAVCVCEQSYSTAVRPTGYASHPSIRVVRSQGAAEYCYHYMPWNRKESSFWFQKLIISSD